MSKLFDINNKVFIVTGASRGIGRSIADGFANEGAIVIGIGRSLLSDCKDIPFEYKALDVLNEAAVSEIFDYVNLRYGRIDGIVNAAGTTGAEIDVDSIAKFRHIIEVNLGSIHAICQTAYQYMKKTGGGTIVNITSIGAHAGFPNNPGYVSSKSGLSGLTRALALDFGSEAIRVNSIAPGYIRTDMTIGSYSDPELKYRRTSRTILERWGESGEILGAAIFLSSDASSYVTGAEILVDGGWLAKGL